MSKYVEVEVNTIESTKSTPISKLKPGTIIELVFTENVGHKYYIGNLYMVSYPDLKWKEHTIFMIDLKNGVPWLNENNMELMKYKIIKIGE